MLFTWRDDLPSLCQLRLKVRYVVAGLVGVLVQLALEDLNLSLQCVPIQVGQ
jgi:hypothetical protein